MNQPTLFEPGPNGCERVAYAPTTGDVARMVNFLKLAGWRSAEDVAVALELGPGETGKRAAREIAARSDGQIISGQQGYAATATASKDEVRHAVAWLRSQAALMAQRAEKIERVMDVTK